MSHTILPTTTAPYHVPELKVMRLEEHPVEWRIIENPEQAESIWRDTVEKASWYDPDKECLVVFLLNTRRRLLGFNLVTLGTLDTCFAHPREVFRVAIMRAAQAVLIGHNHPSGDPTPSEADIKVTRELIRAGQILKIDVLDHMIVGTASPERSKPFVSLREAGYFYT